MKKLIVLVCAVVFLFGVIGIAQAQSDWAYYKEHPLKVCTDCDDTITCLIAEGYKGPRIYILDSEETNDEGCTVYNYTLDCCACHGPDAPGNHGGPQLPDRQCP